MFKLKKSELNRAKQAIEHHGYSTLLPKPIEWEHLTCHWPDIQAELCGIDLEHYKPRRPIVITAAKNERSTRILHLLHPEDMLIYTSMVLIIKDDIEAARLPRTDQRVYSYRASRHDSHIYDTTRHLYKNYIGRLRHKAQRTKTKYVGVTDISNFYSSISQTKLKRLLLAATQTSRRRKSASLLTSVFIPRIMMREDRGIPTGPFASRLLAESLLNEIDMQLLAKGVDFVRWVDDFNFFAKSFASAQRAIFDLSRWLYEEHELTLQSEKTRILKVENYSNAMLSGLEDRLSGKENILSLLLEAYGHNSNGGEEGDLEEVLDDMHAAFASASVVGAFTGDADEGMDDSRAVELLEMLVDAIAGDDKVDYRVIDFAVRRLLRISLDPQTAEEILEVLVENIEALSPVIENVAKLISALVPKSAQRRRRVARRLLRSTSEIDFIDHHAVWILTIFAQDERWGGKDKLIELFLRRESDVLKRYTALATARVAPGELPLSKDDFTQAAPLVRLAMLKAWASAPSHERSPRRLGGLHGKLEEAVGGHLD